MDIHANHPLAAFIIFFSEDALVTGETVSLTKDALYPFLSFFLTIYMYLSLYLSECPAVPPEKRSEGAKRRSKEGKEAASEQDSNPTSVVLLSQRSLNDISNKHIKVPRPEKQHRVESSRHS